MPPDATPKSTEIEAPNSSEASITCGPSAFIVIPKKPPPPNIITVSRNGFSRVQKLNETLIGVPTKGNAKPAPRLRFSRLKTPIARFGSPTEKPALMPSGVTSTEGGSANPSIGNSSLSVWMNASGSLNVIPPSRSATSISGFLPSRTRNWTRSNPSSSATRFSVKLSSEAVTVKRRLAGSSRLVRRLD